MKSVPTWYRRRPLIPPVAGVRFHRKGWRDRKLPGKFLRLNCEESASLIPLPVLSIYPTAHELLLP